MRTSAPAGSATGSRPKLTTQTKPSPRANASTASSEGIQRSAPSPSSGVSLRRRRPARYSESTDAGAPDCAATVSGAQSSGGSSQGGPAPSALKPHGACSPDNGVGLGQR